MALALPNYVLCSFNIAMSQQSLWSKFHKKQEIIIINCKFYAVTLIKYEENVDSTSSTRDIRSVGDSSFCLYVDIA